MVLPASVEDIDWLGNSFTKIKLSEKSKLQNGQISDSMVWSSSYACAYSSQWNREALVLMDSEMSRLWNTDISKRPCTFPGNICDWRTKQEAIDHHDQRNSAPEKLHDDSLSNLKTSLTSLDSTPLKLTYLKKNRQYIYSFKLTLLSIYAAK